MKKEYKLTGTVLGNAWGGGKLIYPAQKYYGTNLSKLKKEIRQHVKSGLIDSGFGFESIVGACMNIETKKVIEIGKELYVNNTSHQEPLFFGKLTAFQKDELFECALRY